MPECPKCKASMAHVGSDVEATTPLLRRVKIKLIEHYLCVYCETTVSMVYKKEVEME